MSGGFYDNNTLFTNPDLNADWTTDSNGFDSSAYMFDSPQPENQQLPGIQESSLGHDFSGAQQSSAPNNTNITQGKRRSHITVPQDPTSQPSSLSEGSSHSSASPSVIKQQQQHHAATPPSTLFDSNQTLTQNASAAGMKMEDFSGLDSPPTSMASENTLFRGIDANMNMEMDNLSLQSGATFDFGAASSPDPLNSGMFINGPEDLTSAGFNSENIKRSMESPPKTIQPGKTFFLGGSREESPNELYSGERSSPGLPMNTSPGLNGPAGYGGEVTGHAQYSGAGPSGLSSSMSPPGTRHNHPGNKWPCPLVIEPIPDKSRVETQIPIRMTLHKPPQGIKRVHLPSHTISKPKFQQKPPFEGVDDTLELSVLLVCASAMQSKEHALENAFKRAEGDEVPIKREETTNGQAQQDDDDPSKPLNGGPVAICAGCIVRERKRAARKKTKKPEEEEEWLKDEAKRVIVFNCSEVKDWCLPDTTKETFVKDHNGPVGMMCVSVPMRIACYCRHQQEKMGFQVIFTLKTQGGEIVSQAISDSIMITDDHKQPIPQAGGPTTMGFAPTGQIEGPFFFPSQQQYGMVEGSGSDLPFRPSYSTPNLRMLQDQFPPQLGAIQRQISSTNLPHHPSTASATPRNLSRPASPTNPAGQPGAKKRRSGGSTNKIPTGLHMTSIEQRRSPKTTAANGNVTSAPTSAGFNFTSPTSSTFGATPIEQSFAQASLRTPTHFTSGPSTPLGAPQPIFPTDIDPSQFYSAPTSQHASRAPSPSSGFRNSNPTSAFNPPPPQSSVPTAAADALSSLPPGLNLNKPPTLQRLIPSYGPRSGGNEVTILGSGFFQGLEVMFGDQPAANTIFWGDTTLVCRAPPRSTPGQVRVCFQHQHKSAPPQVRELQNLMQAQLIGYTYFSDDAISSNGGMQQGIQGMGMSGFGGTPPGSGSVSPPTAGGGAAPSGFDEIVASNGINAQALQQQAAILYGNQGMSNGYNAAYARQPQQNGRNMGMRTVSGMGGR